MGAGRAADASCACTPRGSLPATSSLALPRPAAAYANLKQVGVSLRDSWATGWRLFAAELDAAGGCQRLHYAYTAGGTAQGRRGAGALLNH
jgi:hypothetical protein